MKLAACALLLAVLAREARAADNLLLAGTSDSSLGSYSYVGALIPFGHGTLGQGWVMRQWIDRLTYRYDGFVPDIHAHAYGYSPAIGYQWAIGGASHAALYAGVDLMHTHLSPDDPSAESLHHFAQGRPGASAPARCTSVAPLARGVVMQCTQVDLELGSFLLVRDRSLLVE